MLCEGVEMKINLDALENETRRLLSILVDPQPGLVSWGECLLVRLLAIHRLIHESDCEELTHKEVK